MRLSNLRRTACVAVILLAVECVTSERLPLMVSYSKGKLIDNMFASNEELTSSFVEATRELQDNNYRDSDSTFGLRDSSNIAQFIANHANFQCILFLLSPNNVLETKEDMFTNSDKSFSTSYIDYDSEEFVDKLAQATGLKVQSYDINTNFAQEHQKALKAGKKTIEFIKTPLSLLQRLESVLEKDLQVLSSEKIENFNFIVLFQQSINNIRLLEQEAEEAENRQKEIEEVNAEAEQSQRRILQSENDTNSSNSTNSTNTTYGAVYYWPSYINPSTLFGYLTTIFVGFATFFSLVALLDLKTPKGYIKDNLNVGRES